MGDNRPGNTRPPARTRRSPQLVPRRCTVRFGLTEDELADLDAAAVRVGLARGAYAAEAALSAARGTTAPAGGKDRLRDVLAELVRAAGMVRRIGINLNQAVAKLNATGQRSGDLTPYAAEAIRRSRHLDAVADQVRTAIHARTRRPR